VHACDKRRRRREKKIVPELEIRKQKKKKTKEKKSKVEGTTCTHTPNKGGETSSSGYRQEWQSLQL